MPTDQESMLAFLQELAANPPPLPYEPTLIPLLFAATRTNSKASVDDLTRLIEKSQKLAARVLALANSTAYSLGSPVASLSRAVSVLGFNEVRALVLMASAASAVEGNSLPVQFNLLGLWQHQIKTATIVKTLAITINKTNATAATLFEPDEVYAAGLLHDIGKVFLAIYRPQQWAIIDALARKQGINFVEAEEQHWGLHHSTIAGIVLRTWQLPAVLTDMIDWHHCPEEAIGHKRETHLLTAADMLAKSPPTDNILPEAVIRHLPPDCDYPLIGQVVSDTIAAERSQQLASAMG